MPTVPFTLTASVQLCPRRENFACPKTRVRAALNRAHRSRGQSGNPVQLVAERVETPIHQSQSTPEPMSTMDSSIFVVDEHEAAAAGGGNKVGVGFPVYPREKPCR